MMQEMYHWYMDNMFGYHVQEYHRYAEREHKRKQRSSKKTTIRSDMGIPSFQDRLDYLQLRMSTPWHVTPGAGGKFQNVAIPMIMNTLDQAIIIAPVPFITPKMRTAALARQAYELQRLSS